MSTANGSGSLNHSKSSVGRAIRRTRAGNLATGASSSAFATRDGVEHEIVVSLASLHGDPATLISSLAHWGMNIKCTPVARRLFAEYLASVDVEERVTIVHRTGWLEIGGARAFALPDDIIVGAGDERVILAKDVVGPYGRRGTLEDWKEGVATPRE